MLNYQLLRTHLSELNPGLKSWTDKREKISLSLWQATSSRMSAACWLRPSVFDAKGPRFLVIALVFLPLSVPKGCRGVRVACSSAITQVVPHRQLSAP